MGIADQSVKSLYIPRRSAAQALRLNGSLPMKHSTARFLTTHTGSLPRPEGLTLQLLEQEEGRVAGDLDALADESVTAIVRRQLECGLELVNDGEQTRKTSHPKIFKAVRRPIDSRWLEDQLDELEQVVSENDRLGVTKKLRLMIASPVSDHSAVLEDTLH